jgi:hypothetical protein
MLVGEEVLGAMLGAPGPTENGRHSWWQVALTQFRVLVVKLETPVGQQKWVTAERWAKNRIAVQIVQFPRTPDSMARMELLGFPGPVVLTEIDQPDVHPHLGPFIASWGQPVGGTDSVPVHTPVPTPPEGETDNRKLMMLGGAGCGLLIFCCGCGSVLAVLRDQLLALF